MNKAEIVTHLVAKYNIERHLLNEILPEIFKFINLKVLDGDSINIRNFGTFYMKETAQSLKYHPIKKEKIVITARKVIIFRPARKGFRIIDDTK
ncbi:MAG: HU family DNA-binding protein [Bacteroidales bacterium]